MFKQKQFRSYVSMLLILGLLGVTVACASSPEDQLIPPTQPRTDTPADASPTPAIIDDGDAYPAPDDFASGYPAPPEITANQNEAYPPADDTPPIDERFRFSIDSATRAGDTVVRGTAPPNLSLAVLDVTSNGVVLGTGISDGEGVFAITVSPLPSSRRIGLTFARLEANKTFQEMADEYVPYGGEGMISIPNVGLFLTTMLIE